MVEYCELFNKTFNSEKDNYRSVTELIEHLKCLAIKKENNGKIKYSDNRTRW